MGMKFKFVCFLDHSWAILSSFKMVVVFSNKSADFVLISADVLLKMTKFLKELRMAQLRSKYKQTLAWTGLNFYYYSGISI